MRDIAWELLPLKDIPVSLCCFACRDITWIHIHAVDEPDPTTGPLWVEKMCDDRYFVHVGRDKLLRAVNVGAATISARVLG